MSPHFGAVVALFLANIHSRLAATPKVVEFPGSAPCKAPKASGASVLRPGVACRTEGSAQGGAVATVHL